MSDQQQENEITTTQTAPAAPVTSDQVVVPAPAQTSAPVAPKTAAPTTSAASEEAAPAKPRRTRRVAKPAVDGEEAAKLQIISQIEKDSWLFLSLFHILAVTLS